MSATSSLRSIIYASQATVAMGTDRLEALLVSARGHNQVNGVTGVLLCNRDQFFQCFEGPADAVQETYDRIRSSRLHRDLVTYMDSTVAMRTFEDWAMGCAMPARSELLTLATAKWDASSAAMTFAPGSPPGLGMLKFFWSMRQHEL